MLNSVFLQVLNMSYTASFVILAVLIIRLALKKAPKTFSYALWIAVLFRLISPYSFESAFSFLLIGNGGADSLKPVVSGFFTNKAIVSQIGASAELAAPVYQDLKHALLENLFTSIWLLGIAVLIAYSVVALLKFTKQLKGAVHETDNIYLCKDLCTPFVMGIIRPKIYIPLSISETEKRYILLHEQTHIKRYDHLIKFLSYLALCIHWFNPLVWVAFFLSARDMEMSCDERVIKMLGSEVKKEYSSSLLSLATGQRIIGMAPLAFGEGDTKARIKNVLNYKKPAFWISFVAVLGVIFIAAALMTNPKEVEHKTEPKDKSQTIAEDSKKASTDKQNSKLEDSKNKNQKSTEQLELAISSAVLERNEKGSYAEYNCESHVILAIEEAGSQSRNNESNTIIVYAMIMTNGYDLVDGIFKLQEGRHGPAALTFDISKTGEYKLKEYWVPRDGAYYLPDIKEKFPPSTWGDAINTQKYVLAQTQSSYSQVIQHWHIDTVPIIDKLFQKLMSSPKTSSNPNDYVDAHYIEYRELTYYGDYTLRYAFQEFQKGAQTGLKGHLMWNLIVKLIDGENLPRITDNPQQAFDAWQSKAQEKQP